MKYFLRIQTFQNKKIFSKNEKPVSCFKQSSIFVGLSVVSYDEEVLICGSKLVHLTYPKSLQKGRILKLALELKKQNSKSKKKSKISKNFKKSQNSDTHGANKKKKSCFHRKFPEI